MKLSHNLWYMINCFSIGEKWLVIVGHIPKIMYKLTYFFLKHGGHIKYEITSVKKYSKKKEKEKKNKCTWDCCYSDNQQCKQKSGRCHERKNEFPGVQKT